MLNTLISASEFLLRDQSFSDFESLEHRVSDTELFRIAAIKSSELKQKSVQFSSQEKINVFILCDPPNLALGSLHHPRIVIIGIG
jgi:hypothetical protein